MPEFTEEDVKRWLQLAIDKDCSIHQAVYYDLYFGCIRDDQKFTRGMNFFCKHYGVTARSN